MAPQAAPVTFLSTVAFEDVLCGRPRRLAEAIAKVGDARVTFAESPGLLTAARRRHRTAPPDATLDRLARVRLPSMPRRAVLAESRVGAARARRIAGELRRSVPGVESGWVIVSDPRLAPVLRHLRPGRLCVDCLDHPRIFAGPRAGGLDPSWHRELVRRADLVSWVNPRIRSFLGEELAGKQTCWIGNGVPASWIRAELGERRRREAADRPPVAGFLGALFEWVDLELIAETARRLPEVRFVLCGPTRWGTPVSVLRGLPNLVRLDARPHREARQLLHTFDVGLVPFVDDEIGRCSDPIKLYEYLACGLPVASTLEPAADKAPPSIHVGRGPRRFAEAVLGALDERSASRRSARVEFARRSTWEVRAETLRAAVARVDACSSSRSVVSIRHRRDAPRNGRPRVLFAVRPDLDRFPGGDTVQIRNTATALRRMGVSITVTCDAGDESGPFDCVHLWHLERLHESIAPWLRFRRQGIPMVLSPIYWPSSFGARGSGVLRGVLEDGKNLYRLLNAESGIEVRGALRALLLGWRRGRRKLLLGVDMLLPNSQAEAAILAVESRGQTAIRVVHNAVDSGLCRQILDATGSVVRRGVLSVGHFDPRKNQLGLIRAMRGREERLLLIGGPRRAHRRYFRRCRSEAGPNVVFLGTQPRAAVLRSMRASRLHVCPSHYETPGLANLEAASMGCPLVLPDCPPVREYFGDRGVYFRPGCRESLAEVIRRSLESKPTTESWRGAGAWPDWDTAARETLAAYEEALQKTAAVGASRRPAEAPTAISGRRR